MRPTHRRLDETCSHDGPDIVTEQVKSSDTTSPRKVIVPLSGSSNRGITGSLWMADCLRLQGRQELAEAYLERVLGVANDVNLLSEEYVVLGRYLTGNFPQALTHRGVVNTAFGLCGPVIDRGGSFRSGSRHHDTVVREIRPCMR